jgi:hypothetical protein
VCCSAFLIVASKGFFRQSVAFEVAVREVLQLNFHPLFGQGVAVRHIVVLSHCLLTSGTFRAERGLS